MILYGSYTSPYVRHIRTALAQYSLDYELVDTDYAGSAKGSPTKRVPFLEDGDVKLTDSSSILMHIKQKAGQAGFTDVADFELYTMTNTAMDAEINLFLLSRENLTPDNTKYLQRQRSRVSSALEYLNTLIAQQSVDPDNLRDGQLRLAAFLDWAIFRERFTLEGHDALSDFLAIARTNKDFIATSPPA